MADPRIKILIDAVDNTKKAFGSVLTETRSVQKGLEGMKKKLNNMKPAFKNMAAVGTAAFVGVTAAMKNFLDAGIESSSIGIAYERMSKDMGIAGDKLISKLKEVSKGTVSTKDLMLSSNKAMALGVGRDMETITKLMEIARLKGQNMGLDTTQAFNDIVTGIGRGSPLILDNLGITIKLASAQEQYAEQLGKSVDDLTDYEKSQSILNAVLKSGTEELERMGEVALTPAERMQQLNVQFAEMKAKIGTALIPVFEKLSEKLKPVIDKIVGWIEENPKLVANIGMIAAGGAALVAVMGTLGLVLVPILTIMTALASPIVAVTAAIAGITIAVISLAKNWKENVETMKWIWENFTSWVSTQWNKLPEGFRKGLETIKNAFDAVFGWIIDNTIGRFIENIQKAIKFVERLISRNRDASRSSGRRAQGGSVFSGNSYLVGENGPEIFTPSLSGKISPNSALSGVGGGVNITFTGNSFFGEDDLVDKVQRGIMDAVRRERRI